MRIAAFAKLNLCLHITGKRPDGYHLLESLVAFTEFGDTLELFPADTLSLDITGPFASVLDSKDNLVLKAARLLQQHSKCSQGARIILTKHIPVGAGLGGGSSDAAATLKALCAFWNLSVPMHELQTLALQLGSDVPACLAATAAWVTGIGDQVASVQWQHKNWVLLVGPGKPLLTKEVYSTFKGPFSAPVAIPGTLEALRIMGNDLQAPAVARMPEIADIIKAIAETKGCALTRMSGSGATCFGLYESKENADAAYQSIIKEHPSWWAVSTQLRNT